MEAEYVYTGAHDVRKGEIIDWTAYGDLSLPLVSHAQQHRHHHEDMRATPNGDVQHVLDAQTQPLTNSPTAAHHHDHYDNGHDHEHPATHNHEDHSVGPTHEHVLEHADHDHGHEHHHEHPHTPAITRGWQRALVYGNLVIGAAGIAAGGGDTMSVTIDGGHNLADFGTYKLQTDNELHGHKHHDEAIQRRRTLAHSIIMISSLVGVYKVGMDIKEGEEHATSDMYDIAVASASVLLNSSLLFRARKALFSKPSERSVNIRDITKHFLYVDIPSALLALSGALVQPMNSRMEQVLGIANGAIAAWAFRPTKKNLAHNCLDHDHSHGHDDHLKHSLPEIVNESTSAHESAARRSNRFRAINTGLSNASIRAGVTALNGVNALTTYAVEKIRKRKMVSGALGLGAVLTGGYIASRYGSHDTATRALQETFVHRPSAGPASDAFPAITTHGINVADLQDTFLNPEQMEHIVHLDPYHARSGDGTVWDIAKQLLYRRNGITPTKSEIAEITNTLLADNHLDHQQASHLPIGFPINTSGTHTSHALATM